MKTIKLNYITKIEGHAKLEIKIDKNKVEKVNLSIFEGSRFFEDILKNKKYDDLSHISSRICGVCSVVHSLTSIKAIENAFNLKVSEQTNQLRGILNIAGIIQSHILHLYFLALPDYLGYTNALKMMPEHKDKIKRALKIKLAANKIVDCIGGRDVHPIASVIGGFSRIPTKNCIEERIRNLKSIVKDAKATTELFAELKYPEFKMETDHFSLKGPNYFYSDELISCKGKTCFLTKNYEKHFKEYFREDSTAEFVIHKGKSYMVGALSRLINNPLKNKYISEILSNKNSPYMNNLAQAIEIEEGIRRTIEILKSLKLKKEQILRPKIKASIGVGASEAPRGMLFHKYAFNDQGYCIKANITTPTSQNLSNIEDAIKLLLPKILDKPKEEIILEVEKLIRAYDPCISCSTHFLKVNWL